MSGLVVFVGLAGLVGLVVLPFGAGSMGAEGELVLPAGLADGDGAEVGGASIVLEGGALVAPGEVVVPLPLCA